MEVLARCDDGCDLRLFLHADCSVHGLLSLLRSVRGLSSGLQLHVGLTLSNAAAYTYLSPDVNIVPLLSQSNIVHVFGLAANQSKYETLLQLSRQLVKHLEDEAPFPSSSLALTNQPQIHDVFSGIMDLNQSISKFSQDIGAKFNSLLNATFLSEDSKLMLQNAKGNEPIVDFHVHGSNNCILLY
jgi:hypothetical protein